MVWDLGSIWRVLRSAGACAGMVDEAFAGACGEAYVGACGEACAGVRVEACAGVCVEALADVLAARGCSMGHPCCVARSLPASTRWSMSLPPAARSPTSCWEWESGRSRAGPDATLVAAGRSSRLSSRRPHLAAALHGQTASCWRQVADRRQHQPPPALPLATQPPIRPRLAVGQLGLHRGGRFNRHLLAS